MDRSPIGFFMTLAAIGFAVAPPAMAQPAEPLVMVLSGDPDPDGNGSFATFQGPVLNDQGQVAFNASLTGTSGGSADDRGIFRADAATLVSIAREGESAPDGDGTLSNFGSPVLINDAGQVSIAVTLIDTSLGSSNDGTILRGDGTTLIMIARERQDSPDGNGQFNTLRPRHALNDAGQVAFHATLVETSGGSSDDEALFRGDGATTTVIAREGSEAPGSAVFGVFPSNPTLNSSGEVAFRSIGNQYRGDGLAFQTIAREDDPVAGAMILNLGFPPYINQPGQVAFKATLYGTSGGQADNSGLFRASDLSAIDTIVREGDGVPGGVDSFNDILDDIALNDAGQVAFFASLLPFTSPPAPAGLFRGSASDVPVEVARIGQDAPDGNGIFLQILPQLVALNDVGQVAFVARFSETEGGASDDGAVLLFDDAEGLVTVAREGDPFLGSTITGVGFTGGDPKSPQGSGLNDAGEVAYFFALADGRSGIAVRGVPEPSFATALAVSSLALLARRRVHPRSATRPARRPGQDPGSGSAMETPPRLSKLVASTSEKRTGCAWLSVKLTCFWVVASNAASALSAPTGRPKTKPESTSGSTEKAVPQGHVGPGDQAMKRASGWIPGATRVRSCWPASRKTQSAWAAPAGLAKRSASRFRTRFGIAT